MRTFKQWFTGILLFVMRYLFDEIVFHYIGNLPSSILGVQINDELSNIVGLDTESTAQMNLKKNKYPLKLQKVILYWSTINFPK